MIIQTEDSSNNKIADISVSFESLGSIEFLVSET